MKVLQYTQYQVDEYKNKWKSILVDYDEDENPQTLTAKFEQKKKLPLNFFEAVIEIIQAKKIPSVELVKEAIATVEKRIGRQAMLQHLAYKDTDDHTIIFTSLLRNKVDFESSHYIGELNTNKVIHARGIHVYNYGDVNIRYWTNGINTSVGNYIYVRKNGVFFVKENYEGDDGQLYSRGTKYRPDGTTKSYPR